MSHAESITGTCPMRDACFRTAEVRGELGKAAVVFPLEFS